MITAVIEAQYLPPVAYFSALASFQEIVIEKHENYQKQTYRNRCYVNTVQGKEMLIVPLTSKHGKKRICDVRIDYSQKWLNVHWRTIQSAYGKAPFFEYYSEDLHAILFRKFDLLYDLNLEILTLCLKWLKWRIPIKETLAYEVTLSGTSQDLRSVITPKKQDMLTMFYEPAVYGQVFGNKFVKNLSLIDLIFCEGPGASGIVQASAPK